MKDVFFEFKARLYASTQSAWKRGIWPNVSNFPALRQQGFVAKPDSETCWSETSLLPNWQFRHWAFYCILCSVSVYVAQWRHRSMLGAIIWLIELQRNLCCKMQINAFRRKQTLYLYVRIDVNCNLIDRGRRFTSSIQFSEETQCNGFYRIIYIVMINISS